jgi:putative transcriptional regulator
MAETINQNRLFLTGQLLVATPNIESSSVFNKSVVYILSHNDNGAVGIVINHPISNINCSVIFNSFDIEPVQAAQQMPIYFGGPVEAERGFIIHSNDYIKEPNLKLNSDISLSSSLQILKDIASGNGPSKIIFALGYTGWQDGQLENEIEKNNWICLPFSKEIVFDTNNDKKWNLALDKIGINQFKYSCDVGHA